jgi:hypothetical protein
MKKFDIIAFLQKRPLSWSALSSFSWDPEQWYSRYILSEKDVPSAEMEFGKLVGERLASDPLFLPQVPRYKEFEYKLECTIGKIPLIGFMDSYEPKRFPGGPAMYEYKTGKRGPNEWSQKKADEHGQISMYLFMMYMMYKIKPEDVKVHILWLPTMQNNDFSISLIDEKDVRVFHTKRTMRQVLEFGVRIKETVKAMQMYVNSRA